MVLLRLQKRLAASVLKCGQRKVWLDPNETSEISNANSRKFSVAEKTCIHFIIHGVLSGTTWLANICSSDNGAVIDYVSNLCGGSYCISELTIHI